MTLAAASGPIRTVNEALISFTELGAVARAMILPVSPSVHSSGRLCMKVDYKLAWEGFASIVHASPHGAQMPFCLDNLVPILAAREGGVGNPRNGTSTDICTFATITT